MNFFHLSSLNMYDHCQELPTTFCTSVTLKAKLDHLEINMNLCCTQEMACSKMGGDRSSSYGENVCAHDVTCTYHLKCHISVRDFHIVCHLLCWASGGGGATSSPSFVLHIGISHSRLHELQDVKLLQSINRMYMA